jgi:PKD repeat protein
MLDSSGNGHNGDIGNEVDTGVTFDGATGYRFERLTPNTPPARPEHNVVVPHSASLNPNTGAYSVEVRYRTDNPFGNLIQKGQATTRGGYWKIQLPLGEPNCLFRGPTGVTNAVRANVAIDDNEWHVIRCDRTDDAVEMFVDGVFAGRNTGTTGPIANDQPLSFGGKSNCDQIEVTCDYFGGHVDWVRITRPAATNSPPTASFAPRCDEFQCAVDGSASSDPDGSIASYAWNFGDGSPVVRSTSPLASHLYRTAGSYVIRLTVRDSEGLTGTTTRTVTVPAAPPVGSIAFRDANSSTGNSIRPSVNVPGDAREGDVMIMLLSTSLGTSITGPAGWTMVGSRADADSGNQPSTRVWWKVARAGDAGTPVRPDLGVTSKYDLTIAAYSGVDPLGPITRFATAAETTTRQTHTTPSVSAALGGDRLLSYWTDRTSATAASDWTAPSGQAVRAEIIGSSSGRVNALLTDDNGAGGGTGGLAATANAASDDAVMWSIVLNEK